MSQAYVADGVRTPVGKRDGALASAHPADPPAQAIAAILKRNDVDPALVDDLVFGCVDAIGGQAGNIARTAWLAAGFRSMSGVTSIGNLDRVGRRLFAAQAVLSGTAELMVAGGVANISRIPIASAMAVGARFGFATPFAGSTGWRHRYGTQEVSQFRGAELIAAEWTSAGQRWSGGRCAVISARLLQSKLDGSSGRSLRLAISRSPSVPARRAWRRWLRFRP